MSARFLTAAALCCALLQPAFAKEATPVPLPNPFDAATAGASLLEASNVKLLKGVKQPEFQPVADPQRIGANLAQTHAMMIARMVSER